MFYKARCLSSINTKLTKNSSLLFTMDSELIYLLYISDVETTECFPKPKVQSSSLGYLARLHFPASLATTLVMVPAHVMDMEMSSTTLGPGPQRLTMDVLVSSSWLEWRSVPVNLAKYF